MRNKLFILVLISITSCKAQEIQKPKIEFRGVWIATVVNIDWPKKPEDDNIKKQNDFIAILDHYKKMNFNAVVVQIRTAGDAFYPSELAPISKYLTGKEGLPVNENLDFLKWMIIESHNRGFEFHAWLNPYRATFDLNTEILSPKHDYFIHNDWMIKYGTKFYYNPGMPEVQTHLTKIIEEVVKNYDIDAIHFDDYFYPYKIDKEFFNDTLSFKKNALKDQNIDNWRRSNVDSLVKKVHFAIQKLKPKVQFGISPFGVWRNNNVDSLGSDSRAGQTTFDDLYADNKVWTKNKWIDYLAPQLYWSLENKRASHRKLMAWWNDNVDSVNLYIGNGTYKIREDKDKAFKDKTEISKQIDLGRNTKNVKGNIFFSAVSLMNKNNDVVDLISKQYEELALPPSSPFFEKNNPEIPLITTIKKESDCVKFELKSNFSTAFQYVILYEINSDASQKIIQKEVINQYNLINFISVKSENLNTNKTYGLTFFDQNGNESGLLKFNFDIEKMEFKTVQ